MFRKFCFFFVAFLAVSIFSTPAKASDQGLLSVFEATEKLMDQNPDAFWSGFEKVELLELMKKHDDKKGVERLIKKFSAVNETEEGFGTYTFFEMQIAKALVYLGKEKEALERLEKSLLISMEKWVPNQPNISVGYYPNLISLYHQVGGQNQMDKAEAFVDQIAKSAGISQEAFQIYLNKANAWIDIGEM